MLINQIGILLWSKLHLLFHLFIHLTSERVISVEIKIFILKYYSKLFMKKNINMDDYYKKYLKWINYFITIYNCELMFLVDIIC